MKMTPKQMRELTGLTQERFAKHLGLSRYTVIKAEAGNMSGIVATIYALLTLSMKSNQSSTILFFKEEK